MAHQDLLVLLQQRRLRQTRPDQTFARQQAGGPQRRMTRPTWRAVILSMNMSRSASSGRLPSALTDGLADAALACQLPCACESDQPHHIAD